MIREIKVTTATPIHIQVAISMVDGDIMVDEGIIFLADHSSISVGTSIPLMTSTFIDYDCVDIPCKSKGEM